jgi:hypothetical protein
MKELAIGYRVALVGVCLAPYAWFGVRDLWHHKTHRVVSWTERVLHGLIGLTLTIIVPHAVLGHRDVVVPGLALFMLVRIMDEAWFHRGLAAAETDIHAKTHLGFLIFVAGLMVLGQWSTAFPPL